MEKRREESKTWKLVKKTLGFLIFFPSARLIRLALWTEDLVRRGFRADHINVAFISNFRDETDVRNFGYWSIKQAPSFFSWARYRWNGIRGRLFMIGSLTEEIGGEEATPASIQKAREQFIAATTEAVRLGAEVILLAALTKRLFKEGELEELFPGKVFTLGDNMAGLSLGEGIGQAFSLTGINPKESTALIIAPYGLLGRVATYFTTIVLKCGTVIGLGNPARMDLLESMATDFGIIPATNFEEVRNQGGVDLVVACNSGKAVNLNAERLETIQKNENEKAPCVDPNEPYAFTKEAYKKGGRRIAIRFDAGNVYSPDMHYGLGALMSWILRLPRKVVWGCFGGAFLLAFLLLYGTAEEKQMVRKTKWFRVTPENIGKIRPYFGPGKLFSLPAPTCFCRKMKNADFDRTVRPPSKLSIAWGDLTQGEFANAVKDIVL